MLDFQDYNFIIDTRIVIKNIINDKIQAKVVKSVVRMVFNDVINKSRNIFSLEILLAFTNNCIRLTTSR